MEIEEGRKIQNMVTLEAIVQMIIQCEEGNEKAGSWVNDYKETVILIGQIWDLPAEETMRNLNLIQQEQEVLDKLYMGEEAAHILPESELPMKITPEETQANSRSMALAALYARRKKDKELLLDMADKLAKCRDLTDPLEMPEETQQEDNLPGMELSM